MSKRLTDISVALAVGWKPDERQHPYQHKLWLSGKYKDAQHVPAFTTSLDAIMAEIEAHWLKADLWWATNEYSAYVFRPNNKKIGATMSAKNSAITLCAALLSYLSEREK